MIDLHLHSTASDGTLPPAALVAEAARLGLAAAALTDHDTIAGLAEFLAAAEGTGVRAVPGIELSCSWYSGTMHILGLFIDPRSPELETLLREVRTSRDRRNAAMLARIRHLGIELPEGAVRADVADPVIGRPHIARALVEHGHCRDLPDAFDRFLGTGRPACIRRRLPLPGEVIRVIHAAGGVAVWAHPIAPLRHSTAKLRQTARVLQNAGLDAMETYYSDFSPEETKLACAVAGQLGLLECGGSDFHGGHSPGILMGSGRGGLAVPDAVLAALEARAVSRG
jgi:predicted metal-dependent phosphoesterase TrpH